MNINMMKIELLQESLSKTTQPIAISSANETISWVNDAFCNLLGSDRKQLLNYKPGIAKIPGWEALLGDNQSLYIETVDHTVKLIMHHSCTLESGDDTYYQLHTYIDQSEKIELSRQLGDLRNRLIDSSLRDPLTNLLNMRAIKMLLEPQIARCRRYHTPLLIVSLKPLFTVNQNQLDFHAEHIRTIAKELKGILRWADQINIDEFSNFIIVAPETDLENSYSLVNKVRMHFRHYEWLDEICFGITLCNKSDSADSLLDRAIVALKKSRSSPDRIIKL